MSRSRAAFTLAELMLVLALVAILVAVGWSSMRGEVPRFRMVRAAKLLRADLAELRSIAVETNRETRLVLTSSPGACGAASDYGGSWALQAGNRNRNSTTWEYLPVDATDDGVDDDTSGGIVDLGEGGNRQSRNVCLQQWGSLAGPGSGNGDAVVFSPRGWVTNPGSDFSASGYLSLTLVNLAAAEGVDDRIQVLVARSGNVSLESSLGPDRVSGGVGTATSSGAS